VDISPKHWPHNLLHI